jgi:hypothetical protein
MNPNINLTAIVSQITAIVWQVVGVLFVLLIAAFFAGKFGVRQSIVPTLQAIELLYIAGIFWLARGGKLT